MNDLPVFLQMFIRFFAFLVIGAGLLSWRGKENEKAEPAREQVRQQAPAKAEDKTPESQPASTDDKTHSRNGT